MIDALNILQLWHYVIWKLKAIQKECKAIIYFLVIIIGRVQTFRQEWERFEKSNEIIALNILQVSHDEIKITHAYKSKYDHTRKNQTVLLMITDGEKWYYTALKSESTEDGFNRPTKSLSRLFRGITSNHDRDLYCLNC